ncbi:MAG: hypothetical protein JW912_07930 [Sedimentisphaerales bacterium]|nr:hypothetical protein [Sedimentisphaerales bacterium]
MFTIDLLKGAGVTKRANVGNIVLTSTTVSLPVILTILMFGIYMSDSVAIAVQKNAIGRFDAKISELSEVLEMQREYEEEKRTLSESFIEISGMLENQTQWSPVLSELVEKMPDPMIFKEIEIRRKDITKRVPKPGKAGETVGKVFPQRTLYLTVLGKPKENYDKDVQEFANNLRWSEVMRDAGLKEIRVSQQVDKFKKQEVISYEIECVFTTEK